MGCGGGEVGEGVCGWGGVFFGVCHFSFLCLRGEGVVSGLLLGDGILGIELGDDGCAGYCIIVVVEVVRSWWTCCPATDLSRVRGEFECTVDDLLKKQKTASLVLNPKMRDAGDEEGREKRREVEGSRNQNVWFLTTREKNDYLSAALLTCFCCS